MMSDEDTRDSDQGMQQEMVQLGADLGAETSFVEPEILKMDPGALDKFEAQEPRLKVFGVYLDDIQRRRAHTGSDAEESCSRAHPFSRTARRPSTASCRTPTFPYPTVTLSDGKSVRLDSAAFSVPRALPNRDDRAEGDVGVLRRARQIPRHVRRDAERAGAERRLLRAGAQVRRRRCRRRSTARTSRRRSTRASIDGVNKNLPTFHRYLKLRQRMMKRLPSCTTTTSTRRWSRSVDLTYTPDEAQKHVLGRAGAARRRLRRRRRSGRSPSGGSTCCRTTASAPAPTRTAARTTCTRTCCSTTTASTPTSARWRTSSATRCTATSRTRCSRSRRPTTRSSSPRSRRRSTRRCSSRTCSRQINDPATRLSLLGNYLENIKGTVFRQTQFAEFELRMHEMMEKGSR